jgi:hypothetical protein
MDDSSAVKASPTAVADPHAEAKEAPVKPIPPTPPPPLSLGKPSDPPLLTPSLLERLSQMGGTAWDAMGSRTADPVAAQRTPPTPDPSRPRPPLSPKTFSSPTPSELGEGDDVAAPAAFLGAAIAAAIADAGDGNDPDLGALRESIEGDFGIAVDREKFEDLVKAQMAAKK